MLPKAKSFCQWHMIQERLATLAKWDLGFGFSMDSRKALWLPAQETMEGPGVGDEVPAGKVEICHQVSLKFDNGKPVLIPSSLLVKDLCACDVQNKVVGRKRKWFVYVFKMNQCHMYISLIPG